MDNYLHIRLNIKLFELKCNTLIDNGRSFLKEYDLDENIVKTIEDSCKETKSLLLIHPSIVLFGKVVHQQRSVGFFSDESIGYKYSNKLMKSQKLTYSLKNLLNYVNNKFNSKYNGILVNYYQNGEEYIGKHSDSEDNLDLTYGVVSMSFGASRKFRIRNKLDSNKILDLITKNNKMITMTGLFQNDFTHEVPVEKKIKDSRFSLTFRRHIV